MRRSHLFLPLISLSLFIPMVYHGIWNIREISQDWWIIQFGNMAPLKYLIGLGEIITAFGLFFSKWRRISALIITTLMVGAIFFHLPMGYSFKNNGFETPLAYMMIALALVLEGTHLEKEKST